MEKHIYTKQSGRFALPQFQMLGVLLFLWGLYLAWQLNFLFFLPIIAGAALASAVMGFQIDFTDRMHREYLSVFGYKTGKWTKIPKLNYVTVFRQHFSEERWVLSIRGGSTYSKIRISLIVSESIRIDAGLFNEKEAAMEKAVLIARELDSKLLDYTSPEPKWVEL